MTTQHTAKFGIYLNRQDGQVVRITSPYWFPEPPDWMLVTNEVNATLLKVRQLVKENNLYSKPDEVRWGQIPLRD
ncbi:MAG: hypothetical protein HY683_08080 [Chloroflexi bacterium]|nr:hypothetical protein [Chloroflexota bacterium]